MDVNNIVIIGSGPAGLSSAIYLARAGLSPFIISGPVPGGQLTQTSEVENYPGFESVLGTELANKWKTHAEKFETKIINGSVINIDTNNNIKKISLSSGEIIKAKTILIATGASALWLGLESEQKLKGKGVSACATCDGFFFKNKTVVVVGGGDTAMEEALFLTRFANIVYLIHRRNQFRGSKIMQKRIFNNPKIKILWESQVIDVLGNQKVEGIKLKTTNNETMKQLSDDLILKIDGIFIAIGHKPSTEFLQNSGVLLDEKGYIVTTERLAVDYIKNQKSKSKITYKNLKIKELLSIYNLDYKSMTSVSGIFAAGDCVDFVYRQAATAVGSGVAAALEIEKYLEKEINQPQYQ